MTKPIIITVNDRINISDKTNIKTQKKKKEKELELISKDDKIENQKSYIPENLSDIEGLEYIG
jgi:hypothetical protein